jgi:recombination protein RecA
MKIMSDITKLLNQIRKEFGEDSMFLLGENEKLMNIEVRSSGSLLLDLALGGGYPKGRLVQFTGVEKSGKTSLLCMAIAEAQKTEPDKACAIIDLEQSFNPDWAKTLGVDIDKLFFAQPDMYAERVFALIEYMLKTNQYSIIGLDSVAGLVPRSEFEENDWDKEGRVGGSAKAISLAIRKLINTGLLAKSGTTLIFINQLRDKIGAFSLYGTPTDTVGGHSIKYAATQILEVSTGEYFTKQEGGGKKYLGQQMKIKVSKNKIAPPFRIATVDLYYENGVDRVAELISVAKELGILSGTNWLKLINPHTGEIVIDEQGNEIKFNGFAKAREFLVNDVLNGGKVYTIIYQFVQDLIRG